MRQSFCRRVSWTFLLCTAILIHHSLQIGITPPNGKQPAKSARKTLPNRFIVSLDPKNPKAVSDLEKKLKNIGVGYRIQVQLTSIPEVIYGLSIELEDKKHLKLLRELDEVQDIQPVHLVVRGITYNRNVLSKPLTSTIDKFPPHLQTRINLLHEQRIFGKEIKIALIDNGVDCEHPAFGGSFGKGSRLAFGRGYVDDNGDIPPEGKVLTPCTKCSRHGTHTLGIVGAADVGFGFQGVAPNATLGMYRVIDCESNGSEDFVIAALLQAHQDGADIISASLGQSGGWGAGSNLVDVVNRLVENHGAIILFSAGNSGSDGLFAASSPASARSAISVGSVDSSSPMARAFEAGTGTELYYYRNDFLPDGTFDVYRTSNDTSSEDDACSPLPKNTPDLSKSVVLIKIGGCFVSEKVTHAAAKGAKLILFYMKSSVIITMRSRVLNATLAAISFADGKYLNDQIEQHHTGFSITFQKPTDRPVFVLKPGFISPFSQYGPNFDFESPQPAVSGIGGNVVSTFPMEDGGFASLSGTSMSAPQLAGIAALILAHRGKKGFNGVTMRARLATSTRVLKSTEEDRRPETIAHQGGGLIDAFCAVMANTRVTTASLALNDSISFRPNQEFEVINAGDKPVQYSLTHLPARSVQTFSLHEKYNRPDVTPDTSGQVANAVVTPTTFTLAPGSKQAIKIRFTAPPIRNRDLLTIYSGYILLAANVNCENHNVPYYGVVGSLKDQEIIDRGPVTEKPDVSYPFLAFQSETSDSEEPVYSVLKDSFVWKPEENNFLYIRMRMLFGSPLLRIDVIGGDSNPKPLKQEKVTNDDKTFGGVTIIASIPNAKFVSVPRTSTDNFSSRYWDATVVTSSNKTTSSLPNGKYKLLLRALRVNGDDRLEADYDFWVSSSFQLSRSQVKPTGVELNRSKGVQGLRR